MARRASPTRASRTSRIRRVNRANRSMVRMTAIMAANILRKVRRERNGKHLREQQQRRADADIANDEPAETCQQTKADKEAETG